MEKFWAQKCPELWVPIQSLRGSWVGVSKKTWVWECYLVSHKHLWTKLVFEDKNASLPGPVLLGAVRTG